MIYNEKMGPKGIAIVLISMVGIVLTGIVVYLLVPKNEQSQGEESTIVIGDLVNIHPILS